MWVGRFEPKPYRRTTVLLTFEPSLKPGHFPAPTVFLTNSYFYIEEQETVMTF